MWAIDKNFIIIWGAFALGFYKIIFSHWLNSIFVVWGMIYLKWNEVFSKKPLDSIITESPEHHDESAGSEHH
jgi:hypothetical protein